MKLHNVKFRVLFGAILVLLSLIVFPFAASGTWHNLLNEHFGQPAQAWPWTGWHIAFQNPDWGIENTYWHVGFGDTQALWIMAYPFPSQYDPEYDTYPPNYYRYVYWGPFSLANAHNAQATFYLLSRTGYDYGDSVWWGASCTNPNSYLTYFQGGCYRGNLNDFQIRTYFLSQLDSMGDTISFCGRPQVWVGWFFRSNSNGLVNMGSLIDDVTVGWDDGMFDLQAQFMFLTGLDSVGLQQDPVANDTVLIKFQWHCYGSGETPPFNMNMTLNDSIFYSERRTATGEAGYTTWTQPWIVPPGDWIFRWTLDIDNEITESSETNNTLADTLHVDIPNIPPTIEILTPPAAGDTANLSYLITWNAYDPDDDALIYLFYDTDTLGYQGTELPGGIGIHEDSGLDSLRWDTHNLPNNSTYWILGRIDDPHSSMMIYSHGPLLIDHGTAVNPEAGSQIPTEFSLSSLYPNPFNASTTLTFGVPRTSRVTVQAFNVLGQRVAVLVDGTKEAGYYRMTWSPANFPSGVYLVRMQTPGFSRTEKVVLMK
jgi:hypothetical protein